MKKITSLLLSVCLLLAVVSALPVRAKEKCYSYDKNTKTLTINIQGKMKYNYENAPWKKIKYPEHIVLKKGITDVSDYGFCFACHGNDGARLNYYDRIKTVNLPTSVVSIGGSAFENCKKLEKINIPSSVISLGEMCTFSGCKSLKTITIPGSIKKIPFDAFSDCKRLKKLRLKNGVEKLDFGCFSGCIKLKTITMSNSVKSIGQGAFSNCKNLSKIKLPSKLIKIKKYAFIGCDKLKKITIPKSVKIIETEAFGFSKQSICVKNFTIKGYKGTAAEKYAKKNGFKFVALDE